MKPVERWSATVSGVRPNKPTNAETVGISKSLWKLIQRCWDGSRGRRPQIWEVVAGVGRVATNWHTDMPPGYAQPEVADVVDKLNELTRSGLPWFHLIAPFLNLLRYRNI